jgi:hypothetical protein
MSHVNSISSLLRRVTIGTISTFMLLALGVFLDLGLRVGAAWAQAPRIEQLDWTSAMPMALGQIADGVVQLERAVANPDATPRFGFEIVYAPGAVILTSEPRVSGRISIGQSSASFSFTLLSQMPDARTAELLVRIGPGQGSPTDFNLVQIMEERSLTLELYNSDLRIEAIDGVDTTMTSGSPTYTVAMNQKVPQATPSIRYFLRPASAEESRRIEMGEAVEPAFDAETGSLRAGTTFLDQGGGLVSAGSTKWQFDLEVPDLTQSAYIILEALLIDGGQLLDVKVKPIFVDVPIIAIPAEPAEPDVVEPDEPALPPQEVIIDAGAALTLAQQRGWGFLKMNSAFDQDTDACIFDDFATGPTMLRLRAVASFDTDSAFGASCLFMLFQDRTLQNGWTFVRYEFDEINEGACPLNEVFSPEGGADMATTLKLETGWFSVCERFISRVVLMSPAGANWQNAF